MRGAEQVEQVRAASAHLGEDTEQNRRTVAQTVGVTADFVHGVLGPVPEPAAPARRRDAMPELHESCAYIPAASENAIAALARDIREHGQLTPIALDDEGRLIDGRARWRACVRLGVRPLTRRVRSNGWEYSLAENLYRFPDRLERTMLAAKMPTRLGGPRINDQRVPSSDFLCDVWRMDMSTLKPLRQVVLAGGADLFFPLVASGNMRVGTARRIAVNAPPEEWEGLLQKIEAARAGGPPVELPEYAHEKKRTDRAPRMVPTAARARKGHVGVAHLRRAIDSLSAFGMVYDASNGVDPGINGELAVTLHRDLINARRQLNTAIAELRQRKENHS